MVYNKNCKSIYSVYIFYSFNLNVFINPVLCAGDLEYIQSHVPHEAWEMKLTIYFVCHWEAAYYQMRNNYL